MCVIVDACVATKVFVATNDPDLMKIRTLMLTRKLVVVYGGELAREYAKVRAVAHVVKLLDQAGIARKYNDKAVDDEDQQVKKLNLCVSNDTHVIALARVAGARMLCSADQGLHADFKTKKLIDKPRGRIYQNATHDGLLKRKCVKCKKIG
jgi:hypothetical protein